MQFLKIVFLLVCLLIAGENTEAQTIKVNAAEIPFALNNTDDSEFSSFEPSAIEPINGNYFLAADDKSANLYIIEAAKKKVVEILEIPGFSVGKPKWEAMAFDGEYYYVIGSHSVKLDDPNETPEKLTKKLAGRSHLLRFKLKNTEGDASNIKIDSFIELNVSESLKTTGFYNPDPFKNKVKIEGLTVRTNAEKKKELIFAMREPHDLLHVFFAELPPEPKANDKLSLKPFFSFEAGKIGIVPFRLSSVEYVPQWNGFFLLTSTEDDKNAFFGNALWFVSNESVKNSTPAKLIVPQILWLFAVDMKAEGLCVLPDVTSEELRLAIVFDNDFDDTRIAGKMQFIEVSKN